jgi:hypothetical protein
VTDEDFEQRKREMLKQLAPMAEDDRRKMAREAMVAAYLFVGEVIKRVHEAAEDPRLSLEDLYVSYAAAGDLSGVVVGLVAYARAVHDGVGVTGYSE